MRENAHLRVNSQDFTAMVMNGYDATQEPGPGNGHRGDNGDEDAQRPKSLNRWV